MQREQVWMRECVRAALAEDLGTADASPAADVTSRLAVPAASRGAAFVRAKARGVLAGLECARLAFLLLDPDCRIQTARRDGDALAPGDVVLSVSGDMAALLAAERTALNFLQRLSGIATATAAFVAAIVGTSARIL